MLSPASTTRDARWVAVVFAGRAMAIPESLVVSVADPAPITTIPGAPAPVEGVAAAGGQPCTVVGDPSHSGGTGFFVLLHGRGGLVALRVAKLDGFLADPAGREVLDCGGLLPWAGVGDAAQAAPTPRPPPRPAITVLKLRAGGGRRLALPASAVHRVARVDRTAGDEVAEWPGVRLVVVDDVLRRGRPLARPSGRAPVPEPWALFPTGSGDLLLAEALEGLAEVPADTIHTLGDPGEAVRSWIMEADGELTELLAPGVFAGARRAPCPGATVPAAPVISSPPATAGPGTFDILLPGGLLLPGDAVSRVGRAGKLVWSRQRSQSSHVPVYALDRVLPAHAGAVPRRAVWLRGAAAVLLAADATPDPEPERLWQPPPPLPPGPAAWIDGVRLGSAGTVTIRAKPPAFLDKPLFRLLAAARCGWTAADPLSARIGSASPSPPERPEPCTASAPACGSF